MFGKELRILFTFDSGITMGVEYGPDQTPLNHD